MSSPRSRRYGDGALIGSKGSSPTRRIKGSEDKKSKPIREESFPAELVFQKNDFTYIDGIVTPSGRRGQVPRGTLPARCSWPSSLLMYLKEIRSVLGLIRFLNSNPEWLKTLGLKRRVNGVEVYSVPDRTRFYRLARRVGVDGTMRILSVMVVRLMQKGLIKAKSVSLDATIISAWFNQGLQEQEG